MNEHQFISELENRLENVAREDREEILEDYQEHFAMGKEEGKTEEAIARELGSPQKIAKEILAVHHLEKAQQDTNMKNVLRAAWAGLGIGFLNLLIVLGPFIAVVAIVITGWGVAIGFLGTPLMVLFSFIFDVQSIRLYDMFVSLFLAGAGIFIALGAYALTKVIIRWFMRYLRFNASIVKGGAKYES